MHKGKIEQILFAYNFPEETFTVIMIDNKDTKAMVCSPDGDTGFFDIVSEVLIRDTLASYLFINSLDYVLQTSIDLMKENDFTLKNARSLWYPVETITAADYVDDLVLLANTSTPTKLLLYSLKLVARGPCLDHRLLLMIILINSDNSNK